MSDGLKGNVIDLTTLTAAGDEGRVVEELAECLERFLAARADEPTLIRARAALEVWQHRRS